MRRTRRKHVKQNKIHAIYSWYSKYSVIDLHHATGVDELTPKATAHSCQQGFHLLTGSLWQVWMHKWWKYFYFVQLYGHYLSLQTRLQRYWSVTGDVSAANETRGSVDLQVHRRQNQRGLVNIETTLERLRVCSSAYCEFAVDEKVSGLLEVKTSLNGFPQRHFPKSKLVNS